MFNFQLKLAVHVTPAHVKMEVYVSLVVDQMTISVIVLRTSLESIVKYLVRIFSLPTHLPSGIRGWWQGAECPHFVSTGKCLLTYQEREETGKEKRENGEEKKESCERGDGRKFAEDFLFLICFNFFAF